LIFLDESGAATDLTRLRGRAPRGQRVLGHTPCGHWKTTTTIGSLRVEGPTACVTLEGATDADVFQAYVREALCPTLREGDRVILDNLSPHKTDQTLSLIRQAGAEVLFLPAYSPDLNPIEKMWSKVKQLLRGLKARSQEELLAAIGSALRCVTEADALGWFVSCGYSLN